MTDANELNNPHEAARDAQAHPNARRHTRRRRRWSRYLYVAPLMLLLVALVVFPILYAFRYSFYDYYLTRGTMRFVGLGNYVEAFHDDTFLNAAWVNGRIIVASLFLEFTLGLAFALAAHSIVRGRALMVALLTIPIMVSTSAVGMAFRMIMLPEYGPLNYIIGRLTGREWVAIDWLGDPQWAVWSLVIANVWHSMPFVMLILLAGLVSINQELFEAAKVDGAGYWTTFRDISLPMLRGALLVAFLLRLIELIKMFDLVYLLTQGGPARVTETMSFYVYYVGLRFFRVGYGVTLSLLMLVLTLVVAFVPNSSDPATGGGPMSSRRGLIGKINQIAVYLLLLVGVLLAVFPFYWIATTSFKLPRDHFSKPPVYLPSDFTISHYQRIFSTTDVNALPFLKNSFAIATLNMVFVVLISIPAAYALSRYRVGGEKARFAILLGRMLPPVIVVIPLFLIYRNLGLNNSYIGLVLAYAIFNGPLAVWLLMAFFEDFPTEIIDASLVDGSTEFQALIRVVVPLMAPSIVVVALFCFLTGWNDLIFVLTLGGRETQTLNMLMVNLLNAPSNESFGPAAATVVLGILPPFVLTLFLQRYLVAGLSMGGVKG